MSTTEQGPYPLKSHSRSHTHASYTFVGANGASPTASLSSDPGKVVTGVVRTAEGIYLVTLKRRYAAIHGIAGITGGGDQTAQVTAVVAGGAAANTVEVTLQTGAGTDDDGDGLTCCVMLELYGTT